MRYIAFLKETIAFWWHAWGAIVAPLLEYLGLPSLLFAVCVWIGRFIETYRETRSFKESITRSKTFFNDLVKTPVRVFVVLFLLGGFALGPAKLNRQNQTQIKSLTSNNASLIQTKAGLEQQLEIRRNSISTTDPVFPNIIYLLQAFGIYRHVRGGTPCVIMVTAPPDSAPIASTIAQFSNSVSDCFTFGPGVADPDAEKQAMDGMVPGMIVFHKERDDKAADQLFNQLGNNIHLKLSYDLPAKRNYSIPEKGRERLIWLQFGTGVKWNSQLR